MAPLAVLKDAAAWVYNAGITLVDGVAAAGHSVAHRCTVQGAFAADQLVLTAATAHGAPLRAWTLRIQPPVVEGPSAPLRDQQAEDEDGRDEECGAELATGALASVCECLGPPEGPSRLPLLLWR